jgi:hypothetical protein
MAFKVNIKPEIEADMDRLLKQHKLRSKTEYINQAIATFNASLKRKSHLKELKSYFQNYSGQAKEIMYDIAQIKKIPN